MKKKHIILKSDKSILSKAKKIALSMAIISTMVIATGTPVADEEISSNNKKKDDAFDDIIKSVKNSISMKVPVAKCDHVNHSNHDSHQSSYGNWKAQKRGYHYSYGTTQTHTQHASHSSHGSY